MKLKCLNISTANVPQMRDFYVMTLQVKYDEAHCFPGNCNLLLPGVTIVLCKTDTTPVITTDSCGLEFEVDDVDQEYERLLSAGLKIAAPPETYPWGWRAIGFKDPDGNHISFVQEIQKF